MNKTYAIIFAGCLVATGLAATLMPRPKMERRTESWLEAQVPDKVGKFDFVPQEAGAKSTYRMDKVTYDTLSPAGIVARVYASNEMQVDVVVINSDNGDSFHDPRVCFQSQGSELLGEHTRTVSTKSRGEVPVAFIRTSYNGAERVAAYTYKGPNGMTPAPLRLMMDLFRNELATGKVQEGNFYRFISLSTSGTEEELAAFISAYFDALTESSKGVL
ncbi:MAG: exosortase-associated EpsI family protein [Fimbriimonadaceae bacterium]|nr:exosortase-associated EpsI family protein [Fimbriimonadaceae bacterium]